jgi:hypothetical protein
MKKVSLSIVTAFVFFLAMAVAQDTTPSNSGSAGSAGTEQSSPSMSQGTTGSQGEAGGMQGSGTMKHKSMKGEKTLKGCVRSEGGQYMLEEKSGKMVNLAGSDVSAHVGHEVKVEGMYESGSSGSSTASSSGMSSGHTFTVSNVSMVSDTCTMGKHSKSGSMGNSGSSTQPPQ